MESQAIGQREGAQAGRSALHTAACMGSLVQVVEMLYRGAQVASPSRLHADNGRQPVHLASYGGHVSLVSVLLGRGADPDASDFQGFRPLHIAAQGGSVEVVELLKDSGANLEAQTKTGLQAIHLAAASGHVHMLKQLQSYQCNLAAPDFSSATPLHHAAQHGKLEAVQWLISAGVSIDTKDEEGKSAVDRAVQYTWHEVARVIAAAITKKTSKKTASSQKRSPQPASPCMVHLEATAKIPRLPPTISQQLTPTTNRNPDEIEESSKLPPTNSPSLPSRPLIPSSMRHSPIHLPITDASKISFSNSLASPPAQPDASITTSFPNTSSTPTHERTTAVKEAKKKLVQMLRSLLLPFTCEGGGESSELHPKKRRSQMEAQSKAHSTICRAPEGCGLGHGGGLAATSSPHRQLQQPEVPVMELQVQTAARPFPEGPDIYPCCTNPRGLVLILNNRSFRNNEHLPRYGSEFDITNLENVYEQMGYQVLTRLDLTRQNTLDYFREESKSPILGSVSCLFVFILSHGVGPRQFLTYDNDTVTLDEVQSCFLDQDCPGMRGKPKVFFSHFCRGSDEEIRQTLLYPEAKRPAYRDMLCIYSSTEGFQAYRDAQLGTPAVRALCRTLARHAHCMNLCQVIREFQRLYETMQGATSPEVQNLTFNKDVFLNPTGERRRM